MSKFIHATLVVTFAMTSCLVPRHSAAEAAASAPADQSYDRSDLNMTYHPPAGWTTQDVAQVKAEGPNAKAAECMKILFSSTPPNVGEGAEGLSLGVTVVDAVRSCVPKDMTPEAQLQSMVENTGKMPGLKTVKNPSAYFIDGRTFWGTVAKGKPQLASGSTSNTEVYVAMVGAVVKDHVILWEMTAADIPMLQQMATSTIQFTGKQPHILYKVNIK
ncbi:MAG TPA: hypothetical protein VM554_08430 [Acidisarcina sp.]|nr:hypothetical protein [Acidisarcina sp.]